MDNYASYSGLWGYVAPDGREYALLGCFNGTSIVDITDSSNIHEVDSVWGVGSSWREIKTYSHYAYVVSEGTNSRLQIIDLQYLPDSVHLLTTWNYSGCWAVYKFPSGKIIGSDISNGLFVIKTTFATGIQNISSNPENFSLSQNYPNPFNPETIINYEILSSVKGESSNVKLIVYDAVGKLIATLVDEKQKQEIIL